MAKTKGKSRIGRPPKHGGYSLIVRQGEFPENRRHIRDYLISVRSGLILDLGPTEQNLTTAQLVLIDRLTSLLSIVRLMEEYAKEKGGLNGGRLSESLRESYITYNNSIRLTLQALGIDKQVRDRGDLDGYLESNYGKKGKGNADQE